MTSIRIVFISIDDETNGLRELNIFIIRIYLKYWYECCISTLAPKNDLQLIKDLIEYKKINSDIAEEVLKVVKRHLWYLSETLIGLAFFDRTTDVEEKRLMLQELETQGHVENPKRKDIDFNAFPKYLHNYVTENTMIFFEALFDQSLFSISTDFLKVDPSQWYDDPNYLGAEEIVRNLFVVNDVAERAVALATKFNDKFTRNEEHKQNVFQTVEYHRKLFPNKIPRKRSLMEKLKN